MLGFKIHWGAFFFALAIGMFYVYIRVPPPKIVIKYPTPDNVGKVVYKDEAENCYVYKAIKQDSCPKKSSDTIVQSVSTQ
jgi:hypothetical protein